MNKFYLHIAFLLISAVSFGQNADEKEEVTWKKERKKLRYIKEEGYKGPDDWYGSNPSNIKVDEEEFEDDPSGINGGSIPPGYRSRSSYGPKYNSQQIQKDRQKRNGGFDKGGGDGTLKYDPKIKRPDPADSPDLPDYSPPDLDPPDVNSPKVATSFWKILLFIGILVIVAVVLYYLLKNYRTPIQKVHVAVENEWNPEIISKTELELKLEAAMEREDFRECVRIYFTFILKELISKGWIRWKKEKTNHHYVMEMGAKQNVLSFMECVRIYDLIWYGDYNIDRDIFEMLKPTLEDYYKSLEPSNE